MLEKFKLIKNKTKNIFDLLNGKFLFDDREFDDFNDELCMSSELIKKLLDTKTEEDFFETLTDDTGTFISEALNEEIIDNIDLWDKRVVKHCMKLTGLSYDKLKETMMIDELE